MNSQSTYSRFFYILLVQQLLQTSLSFRNKYYLYFVVVVLV